MLASLYNLCNVYLIIHQFAYSIKLSLYCYKLLSRSMSNNKIYVLFFNYMIIITEIHEYFMWWKRKSFVPYFTLLNLILNSTGSTNSNTERHITRDFSNVIVIPNDGDYGWWYRYARRDRQHYWFTDDIQQLSFGSVNAFWCRQWHCDRKQYSYRECHSYILEYIRNGF